MEERRIRFLGSGTSHGVPVIGCHCPVCASPDPRDRRWRSSLLVQSPATSLIVDAGPEFRLAALAAGLESLDALLLSHAHADHLHGLDDVRPLSRNEALPVWGNAPALAEAAERFSYVFRPSQVGGGKPRIELRLAPEGAFRIGELEVLAVPLLHGELPVLGWRFGNFAWLTDCSAIPAASFELLAGVEVLAIDGLRRRPHPTHFSVDEAIAAAARIGARETWLVHICHDHSHADLEDYCRERGAAVGARPAWDGLELEL
jgi:phosphoribosyl 1,2-cyclic phosphate phosphodiesterase